MRRIRRWWSYTLRELRRVLVCRRVGHEIEWRESAAHDMDAYEFSARCRRCHRVWPKVVGFTFSLLRSSYSPFAIQDVLDKKARELRFARTMTRAEERRMADYIFLGDDL